MSILGEVENGVVIIGIGAGLYMLYNIYNGGVKGILDDVVSTGKGLVDGVVTSTEDFVKTAVKDPNNLANSVIKPAFEAASYYDPLSGKTFDYSNATDIFLSQQQIKYPNWTSNLVSFVNDKRSENIEKAAKNNSIIMSNEIRDPSERFIGGLNMADNFATSSYNLKDNVDSSTVEVQQTPKPTKSSTLFGDAYNSYNITNSLTSLYDYGSTEIRRVAANNTPNYFSSIVETLGHTQEMANSANNNSRGLT
jgi:hypothetical protein